MLKVDNAKAFGIVDALRGMRNPLNSWAKSDTVCMCDWSDGHILDVKIGPNDLLLCRALTYGGEPHRKFLRQIVTTMDITAPAYWWAEMDTYKVCTTRNSCSVQHKGSSRDFTTDDFTLDVNEFQGCASYSDAAKCTLKGIVDSLNMLRKLYVDTKDYKYFRLMRQLMPMGYNYKATWTGTYETLLNIYEWRHAHKLIEWHMFCDEIKKLPGMEFFISCCKKETSCD